MGLGKLLNKFTDEASTGVALVGLALAPFTGGGSLLLSLQAIGTSKLIAYGVENLEETLFKTK
jgi:hypothetical protein